jgi:hypothetical protein
MKRIVAQIAALLTAALLAGTVMAQGGPEVVVSAEADRETITVGDRIVYTVRAEHDKELVVDFPQLASTWGDFEVLSQRPLQPGKGSEGRAITGKEYVITAFTVGEHSTPPLRVSYLDRQGQPQEVETDSIRITVTSVLTGTEGVTSTLDIRDPWRWPSSPCSGLWSVAGNGLGQPPLPLSLTSARRRRSLTRNWSALPDCSWSSKAASKSTTP